jgi:AcrR family transcriptional regulator
MSSRPTPTRLPRGRHGLSREEVVESQRTRMLQAMADAVAEQGYAKTSVADVLERAGVSRETFYEQFGSKQDCFLDAFDAAGEILLGRVAGAASASAGTPVERFDALLGAYLDTLASEPAYARIFLVEAHAAGPEALRRRVAIQERFIDALVGLFGAVEPHERLACELLVNAGASMATTRLALGDDASLPELRAPVVDLIRRWTG